MNDARAMWKAIAIHPREDTPKLALADWYEEDAPASRLAYALRWCVARGKWPWPHDFTCRGGSRRRYRRYSWSDASESLTRQSTLPTPLYLALPGGRNQWPGYCFYVSELLALRDLGDALHTLLAACEIPT